MRVFAAFVSLETVVERALARNAVDQASRELGEASVGHTRFTLPEQLEAFRIKKEDIVR